MTIQLEGQVERITFHNSDNGFSILRVKTRNTPDLITMVGSFPGISPGESVRAQGQWVHHPRYGEQFKVISYQTLVPATEKGIEKYLGSGLIKGIGPVTAHRLVQHFGTDTLRIIEEEPARLQEVEGIGNHRLKMICKAWEEQKDIRELMLFLQEHGVSPTYGVKIFRRYGREALVTVRDDPYRLARDIFGIGFLTADRIAQKLGIAADSPKRLQAGLLYILQECIEEGHVYFPRSRLLSEAAEKLDVPLEGLAQALRILEEEKSCVTEPLRHDDSENGEEAVFLPPLHTAECGCAKNLSDLFHGQRELPTFDMDRALSWVQKILGFTLAPAQVSAVRQALEHKVSVITGGPGTGKTTITKAIIHIYKRLKRRVMLVAPTGRAAKRMSETCGMEARTLHRALEFQPGTGWKRNDTNPLEADVFIVDEMSMVDTVLMYHFLKALPSSSTLVLVGDVDQLPSVGPGCVLRDIISSSRIPTVVLSEIFRQSRHSLIVVNAHRVNQGRMPMLGFEREKPQDFYFFPEDDPEYGAKTVVELVTNRIPQRFGFHPSDDIQVITPMHRGTAGAAALNLALQNTLNPGGEELVRGGRTLRAGDKVMQIRNNYDKEVFNGDIGKVKSIDKEGQEVTVTFEGRDVTYDFSELDELVPAYAITVHKSQGSEYPVVVIPIFTQHYPLLQRNLLYTALTRGRKLTVVVGTKRALAIAVKNHTPVNRCTRLRERLQEIKG